MSQFPEHYQTFEAMLVSLCAPTLAGLKSGSIFSVGKQNPEMTAQKVRKWDEKLSAYGVRLQILKEGKGNAPTIIYVYRPEAVRKEISGSLSQAILQDCGYPCKSCANLDDCLQELSSRLMTSKSFPHEIGLYIGYPPEDVRSFIENEGRNFEASGLWKVYHRKEECEKYFKKCGKCQRIYESLFKAGRSVEKLTVAQAAA